MATKILCSVNGCGKNARGACGWCTAHYMRHWKYGDPLAGGPNRYRMGAFCIVDGCNKQPTAHGYCVSHYKRFLRHGDPTGGGTSMKATSAWIEAHRSYQSDECLTWPFSYSIIGYGTAYHNGEFSNASRIMCIAAHGEPPAKDFEAAHDCGRGNLGCVNPRHLSWKTKTENEADKLRHGTHNRGENHGMAKLCADDVLAIRSSEDLPSDLAIRYGVSRTAITKIKRKKSWAWLE
ncbi:hypothetical protein [Rhizobium sp. AC27/96]|uniref:hypothetical protein n=1 Tax=Rhizobium sp. AC27/96 TaxID=1841653 RepID=UPI001147A80F|nr:hypothetical protein [Rhizobium sp. AC27/96]